MTTPPQPSPATLLHGVPQPHRAPQKRGPPADDGGGDILFWQRRRHEAACDDAHDAVQRCVQESAAAVAFVEWWVADCAARVAARARMQRHRERVATRIAAERAKGKPLSREARLAAQAATQQRDAEEQATKQQLARAHGHGHGDMDIWTLHVTNAQHSKYRSTTPGLSHTALRLKPSSGALAVRGLC